LRAVAVAPSLLLWAIGRAIVAPLVAIHSHKADSFLLAWNPASNAASRHRATAMPVPIAKSPSPRRHFGALKSSHSPTLWVER